jgi:hypothetical protein
MILSHTSLSVTLPNDAAWKDRYSWSPVVRKEDYGVGDGDAAPLIVDVFVLATGRPISLAWAYMPRSTLEQLCALAEIPAATLTWQWVGEPDRTVQFRGSDPIKATQLIEDYPAEPGDWFSVTANLMEVA